MRRVWRPLPPVATLCSPNPPGPPTRWETGAIPERVAGYWNPRTIETLVTRWQAVMPPRPDRPRQTHAPCPSHRRKGRSRKATRRRAAASGTSIALRAAESIARLRSSRSRVSGLRQPRARHVRAERRNVLLRKFQHAFRPGSGGVAEFFRSAREVSLRNPLSSACKREHLWREARAQNLPRRPRLPRRQGSTRRSPPHSESLLALTPKPGLPSSVAPDGFVLTLTAKQGGEARASYEPISRVCAAGPAAGNGTFPVERGAGSALDPLALSRTE